MKDSNRIAVCLITDSEDNILMGHREIEDKWATVGGHIHEGEDPYSGCQRELKEEVGLDAICIKLVKVEYVKKKKIFLYLFKITIDPEQKIDFSKDPDEEFDEVKYLDPNSVKDELHVPIEDNIALQYWMDN